MAERNYFNGGDLGMLEKWSGIYEREKSQWETTIAQIEKYDSFYSGEYALDPLTKNDKDWETGRDRQAGQIWRLCAELIESTVDGTIPQPKVTAQEEQDEELAAIIEDMLRDELDRMPTEYYIDLMERLVPTDGGAPWLIEWDNSACHGVGGISLTGMHPKLIVPQDGIYTDVQSMDYIFVQIPSTRRSVEKKYNVELPDTTDDASELKGTGGTERAMSPVENMVTVIRCYYRNDKGGVGVFAWCGETVLENYRDYWARHEKVPNDDKGESFTMSPMEGEELTHSIMSRGQMIPAIAPELDTMGMPVVDALGMPQYRRTVIPYYKPDIFPIVIQRNITKYGKLLGESEVEKVIDQQNIMSRMMMKIQERIVSGGSIVTLPPNALFSKSSDDVRTITITNPAEKEMIGSFNLEFDISQDMSFLQMMYTAAKNVTGVTDSWLGRPDTTAQSGRAKESQAAQTAGRLESRKVMKRAAWSRIFEMMFKLRLAYTDEPLTVRNRDIDAQERYRRFNRYDFLEPDGMGGFEWNDKFLFSVDTDTPPANNRMTLWTNAMQSLQMGAFGDIKDPATWVMYWTHMRFLHAPDADKMLELAKARQEQAQAQTQMQQQMQMQQEQQQAAMQNQAAQQSAQLEQTKAAVDAGMRQQEIELRRREQDIDIAEKLQAMQQARNMTTPNIPGIR